MRIRRLAPPDRESLLDLLETGGTFAREEIEVVRKGLTCLARLVWRDNNAAGLLFCEEHETGSVVTLDWARKLRASERANRRLKSRLNQLLSEY